MTLELELKAERNSGIKEGIKIGKQQGIKIGDLNARIELATSLLKENFSIEKIQELTKLDRKQIESCFS